MESSQLRSYIAPGCPATRTPCDGTEGPLRVEFGFTPRWYRAACGIDFSERWHLDPVYRGEAVAAMGRTLHARFPELDLGSIEPEAAAMNLDGIHGGVFVARLFGIPADYYEDNWPAARHVFLDDRAARRLAPIRFESNPVFAQILEQADVIEAATGRVQGYLNWQGVLNNAYRLRGPAIFTDLVADPPLAHHLFEVIAETLIAGMQLLYARQAESGVTIRHATLSNCLVNMVSPDSYAEHILPYDKRIGDAFPHFGVHNCAWCVDPYLPHYAALRPRDPGGNAAPLGYLDMGIHSDFREAKRRFPHTRRAVMYTPMDLANKPLEELHTDLARIYRGLGPCDIVMADIDAGTPDTRVHAFAQIARQVPAAL